MTKIKLEKSFRHGFRGFSMNRDSFPDECSVENGFFSTFHTDEAKTMKIFMKSSEP